jgi:predicted MFS family arabinose efflux permease
LLRRPKPKSRRDCVLAIAIPIVLTGRKPLESLTVTNTETRRGPKAAFAGLLFAAMGIAILPAASLGILASFIIDDLEISRAKFGLLVAVINIAAAVFSPLVGRVTDRIGGRSALLLLFGASALFYLALGLAASYFLLLVVGLAGAYAQASANPATNKLIAGALPAGERGVTTGVKQSGVQAGIFLAGLTLPSIALAYGWRAAYLLLALVPVLLLAVTPSVIPRTSAAKRAGELRNRVRLPADIWWLMVYGFLMGFAGAVTFLIPLFVEESLGLDPRVAGFTVAIIGLVAVGGRIVWSRYAEQSDRFRRTLGILAVISIGAVGGFWLAEYVTVWLILPAAVALALGSSSWNSVGMLAVITSAGAEATGRASGFVLLGFLTGLGMAPPIFGAIVDRTGQYDLMWLLSATALMLAAAVTFAWGRSR